MADKPPKPRFTVELEPGQYLVDVFPNGRTRVWTHHGNGRVSGPGGKFTKPSVGQAFYEMTVWGQHYEEENPHLMPPGRGVAPRNDT